MMQDVFILSAKRSAIGTFGGALAQTSASDLLTQIMQQSIAESGVSADSIETSILGNVVHTSSVDPYLARQCAVNAGLPIAARPSLLTGYVDQVCRPSSKRLWRSN